MSIVLYWKGSLREIAPGEQSTLYKTLGLDRVINNIEDLQAVCSRANLRSYTVLNREPLLEELELIPVNLAQGHSSTYLNFWTPRIISNYQQVKGLDTNFNPIDLNTPVNSPVRDQPQSTLVSPIQLPIIDQSQPSLLPVAPPQTPFAFPVKLAPTNNNLSTMTNIDIPTLISNAIGNITFIDSSIFDYQGFDPIKIRELILAKGTAKNPQQVKVGGKILNFLGNYIGNDVAFMVTLGLLRGNGLKKIEQKSVPELNTILKIMSSAYALVEKTDRSPTAITLMRVVNAFPEVAYAALLAGRGRDITGLGFTPVLANSVSFQMVHPNNFKDYAMHFLYVNHLVDKVINKPPKKITELKDLWNYMILSYNSSAAPIMGKRLNNIGIPSQPVKENFSFPASPYWPQIEQKINNNDASVL